MSYQLYDGERVAMPASWSGRFTDDVGIAYYAYGRHAGRRAYILHCPWRRGPGWVRLGYPLELPRQQPIVLTFGIAMRPDVVGKSDGVTFSAFLIAGGRRKELMREHYAKAAWKDFRFDLSAYAGQRVLLALQAEPGPERNSGFDFSMLGEPTLTVGEPRDGQSELLRAITRSRAYRRTADRSVASLASTPINGVVPSTNDPHRTRVEKVGMAWHFQYLGDDCRVEYRLPLGTGSLSDLVAQVDSTRPFHPCQGGGVRFATDKPDVTVEPERAELVSERVEADRVELTWRYHQGGRQALVTWGFRLVGKALAISAESEGGILGRLSLGQPWTQGLRRPVRVPYLPTGQAYYLKPQHVY
ncbi:MAG: hypothetical protein ACODAJ_16035, partial [Planctomycetota bacterium]